jgi:hypothetical protein
MLQVYFALVIFGVGLTKYLPRLTSNHDLSNLNLQNSWIMGMNHWHWAPNETLKRKYVLLCFYCLLFDIDISLNPEITKMFYFKLN